ncbi:MAG: hypothetical protein IPO66_06650 [Rhodanobacteraceae bacterium]|nr:hypothetical protein [Rhodanobacteraceae bacterium]
MVSTSKGAARARSTRKGVSGNTIGWPRSSPLVASNTRSVRPAMVVSRRPSKLNSAKSTFCGCTNGGARSASLATSTMRTRGPSTATTRVPSNPCATGGSGAARASIITACGRRQIPSAPSAPPETSRRRCGSTSKECAEKGRRPSTRAGAGTA